MKDSKEKNMSNTTKIFQPKLLKLKETDSFFTNINPMDVIISSNDHKNKTLIEQSLKKLKKFEVSSENSVNEGNKIINKDYSMQEKLVSYYKNPFKYMDYIVEKYCKYKMN